MAALDTADRIVATVSRGLCLAAGIILLVAMGLVTCLDIVLRQFGAGIPGIWEGVNLAMRWMIGLALPYAFYTGSHIAVELFTDWFPPRLRQWAVVWAIAISLCVISLLAWKITGRTLDTRANGGFTSDLGLPTYFDWVPLALGPALSVPVLVLLLCLELRRLFGRHAPADKVST